MLSLRDYQRESLDALYDFWEKGGGDGLIVLPTGAGKALVIAALARELLERWPDLRICIVTHSRELVSQDAKELAGYWPGAPVGVYSAGLNRRDTRQRIIVASIQSVWNKAKRFGAFDVVIVDEAHLISRSSNTQYGRFLRDLRDEVPDMRVVGATATPYRLDSGRLDEGEGRLFERVVYEANVGDLIRQGYLSPLVNIATKTELKTDGVAKRGGDFAVGELGAAVDQEHLVKAAAAEIVRAGCDRRAWLAFCVTVEHAQHVAAEIRSHGITCETVSGETPAGERDRLINAFRAGRIRCLTSVGVLSTGFNVPHVDLVALMRPTQSAGLYVQQVGRALRKADGKKDALILDFGRLIRGHGPIDAISVKKPKRGDGAGVAPHKTCPACQEQVHASVMECSFCGHEFEALEKPVHDARPDEGVTILAGQSAPWVRVNSWSFASHTAKRDGAKPCLRVNFRCGVRMYPVFVCLEHGGLARAKAVRWWRLMSNGARDPDDEFAVPSSVSFALSVAKNELRMPFAIQVRPNGKYFDVLDYQMDPVADDAEPLGAAA